MALNCELVVVQAQKLLFLAKNSCRMIKSFPHNLRWLDERIKGETQSPLWRICGEASNADVDALLKEMPCILQLVSLFAACDVWNADYVGMFYK